MDTKDKTDEMKKNESAEKHEPIKKADTAAEDSSSYKAGQKDAK